MSNAVSRRRTPAESHQFGTKIGHPRHPGGDAPIEGPQRYQIKENLTRHRMPPN